MIDEAAFFEFKALQKQLKHCYSFPILPHAPLSSTWPDLVFNWAHWAVYPCWCHQKSPTMPHLLNLGRLFNRQLSPILPEGLASDFISSYSLLERFPVAVPMPVTTTDYRGRRKTAKILWSFLERVKNFYGKSFQRSLCQNFNPMVFGTCFVPLVNDVAHWGALM